MKAAQYIRLMDAIHSACLVIADSLGVSLSQLSQFNNDPRQMLDQLQGIAGEVEKIGEEKVRGVDTTHYEASVDLHKYPDRLPPEQREAARQSVERLIDLTGRSSYPIEVWIDDDKLLRRMKLGYSIKIPGQAEEASFSMRMEFFDFGTPVSVEPPPEDEVTDISELAKQFGGGAAGGGSSGFGGGGAAPGTPAPGRTP